MTSETDGRAGRRAGGPVGEQDGADSGHQEESLLLLQPGHWNYYYGQGHPMKPHRIHMTHNLLLNYGLYQKMEIYRPHKANAEEMTKCHSDDNIKFLHSIHPDNMSEYSKQMRRFNVGEGCPVFGGSFEFCQLSMGNSVASAVKLSKQQMDIAVNWAGGLHHAKKSWLLLCQ